MQLRSHPDIYAAGDVIDWAEQKQAAKASSHAAVVVANILSAVAGQTPVTKYKSGVEMILVTNGKVSLSTHFSEPMETILIWNYVRMEALRTSTYSGAL